MTEDGDQDDPGRLADTLLATQPSAAIVSPQWVAPDYRARTTMGDRVEGVLPPFLRNSLLAVGEMYTMFAASLYGLGADLIRRKFQFKEFIDRSWFLVS